MKLANMDGITWLIIFVVVALVKGWSKLQKSTDDDSSSSSETPPVTRAKPRIPPPRPRLQPRSVPMPMPRSTGLPQPAGPRATPPPVPTPVPAGRKVGADEIRRFIEQLSGQSQTPAAPPPPIPSTPVRTAEPPPLPPKPEPVVEAPVATQTIASAPVPAQTSRASQWMEALRDRNNVRNIIISAEIIGPPRAESM